MSERLPAIDIAVSGAPAAFLDGMAELGEASALFDVDRHRDGAAGVGFYGVNFRLKEDGLHRELSFQLLLFPPVGSRVQLEVRARRWNPDPPTRQVYCEAARSLVGPLLRAFNRAHGARYRLRIEPAGAGEFRLSARTASLLDSFSSSANTASLHPLDWGRFYRLVSEGRQELPEAVLRSRLIQAGFSPQAADRLADVYRHLWAFKRLR